MISRILGLAVLSFVGYVGHSALAQGADGQNYLDWSSAKVQQIIRVARVNGRVGGAFDLRALHTERSYNYKLRATWLTEDVIEATARLIQLSERLTAAQAEALVAETATIRGTVVMVEIDPREGSGVIPLDWWATFGPKEAAQSSRGLRGTSHPEFKTMKALSGGNRRDYDYEVFWLEFPVTTAADQSLFAATSREAELVVRIYDKEGHVTWPIPPSFKGQ